MSYNKVMLIIGIPYDQSRLCISIKSRTLPLSDEHCSYAINVRNYWVSRSYENLSLAFAGVERMTIDNRHTATTALSLRVERVANQFSNYDSQLPELVDTVAQWFTIREYTINDDDNTTWDYLRILTVSILQVRCIVALAYISTTKKPEEKDTKNISEQSELLTSSYDFAPIKSAHDQDESCRPN